MLRKLPPDKWHGDASLLLGVYVTTNSSEEIHIVTGEGLVPAHGLFSKQRLLHLPLLSFLFYKSLYCHGNLMLAPMGRGSTWRALAGNVTLALARSASAVLIPKEEKHYCTQLVVESGCSLSRGRCPDASVHHLLSYHYI